jgi:dihydrofolate reductase
MSAVRARDTGLNVKAGDDEAEERERERDCDFGIRSGRRGIKKSVPQQEHARRGPGVLRVDHRRAWLRARRLQHVRRRRAWGGTNPFPGTLIVLTQRTEDQPDPSAGFLFVDGFDAALMKARELAGDGGVSLGGGADLIRQGLAAGVVDELAISTAPLVLGGGKRLFEGFEQDIDLEVLGTWSSQYATHARYAVRRAGQEYAAH